MLRALGFVTLAGMILCCEGAQLRPSGATPWASAPMAGAAGVLPRPSATRLMDWGSSPPVRGQYNLQTAKADAINADTIMRFNEYIWESQQTANRIRLSRQEQRKQRGQRAGGNRLRSVARQP